MKKIFSLIMFFACMFFSISDIAAFSDKDTHREITKLAAKQSILQTNNSLYYNAYCYYLKDYLGFEKGLDEFIAKDATNIDKSILSVIMDGAQTEDSGTIPGSALCKRGLNHFYDPSALVTDPDTHAGGLSDKISFISPELSYIANLK